MARSEPPYLRIVDDIRRRIRGGELGPGDRVPSARRLTQDWGVAIATATKALAALQQQGLTRALPGVGTVVADPEPSPVPSTAPQPGPAPQAKAPSSTKAPVRRAEPDLDRARIVAAAVAIADAEGMAEVSMRRIAAALGAATMSLYRHVPSKDELVLGMIDTAFVGLPSLPDRTDGWRPAMELAGASMWALFRRHPWLASAMSLTRPQLAPNGVWLTEWVLRALEGTGLGPADRLRLHIMLFGYLRGVALGLEQETEAHRHSGLTSDEWMARHEGELAALLATGALPSFARLVEEDFDLDLDELFEFGLARLLDGIEVLLTRRAG